MSDEARRFWDARAAEDAPHFVDDRLPQGARDYEALFATGPEVLEAYEDLLGVSFDDLQTVVEVGCGVGRATRALAGRVAQVIAVDVSPQMLATARESNPGLRNVTWMLGDGASLAGISDGSADACFSHVVFQHIPDPEITLAYVREMGRVLRPGGWAAFQVSNDPHLHRPRPEPGATASPYWLGSAIELADLRQAAAGAGMEIETISGAGTQWCLVLARRA